MEAAEQTSASKLGKHEALTGVGRNRTY